MAQPQPGETGDDPIVIEDMQTEPPLPVGSGNEAEKSKEVFVTPVVNRDRGKRGRFEVDPDSPSPMKVRDELSMSGIGDATVSLITWFHSIDQSQLSQDSISEFQGMTSYLRSAYEVVSRTYYQMEGRLQEREAIKEFLKDEMNSIRPEIPSAPGSFAAVARP